jgi:methionine aminotransferase
MSAMAQDYGAINLSQGFPDFPVDGVLLDRINYYYQSGFNQYAPMPGVPELRERLAEKYRALCAFPLEAHHITITPGATAGIFAAVAALLNPGDEAIVFEPAYDSYIPAIQLQGAKAIRIPLSPGDYAVPWEKLRQAISTKTKLILVNTPHNPTGAVFSQEDWDQLAAITRDTDILIVSDEVYEHIIFDDLQHWSVLQHPELCHKSLAIFSFGKTFHATGWKMGYVIAPEALTHEFRKVHQFMVFSVHSPLQYALADYLSDEDHYLRLPNFYQQKRDYFLELMKHSRFAPVPCHGTYFQLMSYRDISDEPDLQMAERITKAHGVASIPISPFFADARQDGVLRFCFAKQEETLQRAAEKLCKI